MVTVRTVISEMRATFLNLYSSERCQIDNEKLVYKKVNTKTNVFIEMSKRLKLRDNYSIIPDRIS